MGVAGWMAVTPGGGDRTDDFEQAEMSQVLRVEGQEAVGVLEEPGLERPGHKADGTPDRERRPGRGHDNDCREEQQRPGRLDVERGGDPHRKNDRRVRDPEPDSGLTEKTETDCCHKGDSTTLRPQQSGR